MSRIRSQILLPANVFHITRPSHVIVGSNTDTIWAQTLSKEAVAPRSDGWWGPHEFSILPQIYDRSSPYLAWIPSQASYTDRNFHAYTGLDPSLSLLSFETFPLVPITSSSSSAGEYPSCDSIAATLPPKPHALNPSKVQTCFVSTSEDMRAIVKEKVFVLMAAVRQAISNAQTLPTLQLIRMPEQALFRLEQAYYWNLLPGTVTAIGHILVLAGLKRAVYELHGFLLWLKDMSHLLNASVQGELREFKKPYRTRGVIVQDIDDFHEINRFCIAVYMEIDLGSINIPHSARHVPLSPIPISRQLLVPCGLQVGHHTYIIFYPPIVEDFSLFELAARGYASRLDDYQPDKTIDRLHTQLNRDIRLSQGIYFPYMKCPVNHLRQQIEEEYIGIQPFAPLPPLAQWSLGRREMEWPMSFKGPGRPPPIVSATPPPLLFFRCSKAEKQQAFFYIWICIRRQWMQGLLNASYGTPERTRYYLTHQEWRQLLSGERFKKAAQKLGKQFDLRRFWLYDPFLWEDGYIPVPEDIIPRLEDSQTCLTPCHFLDSNKFSFNLKRLLCYDIALTHVVSQFEETDEIYIKERNLGKAILTERRFRRSKLFRCSLFLQSSPPRWESTDPDDKVTWFEELRLFLCDWPPASTKKTHCDIPLTGLQEPALSQQIHAMLRVYYTGVIKSLNTIPTLMWTFPGCQGLEFFMCI